MFRSVFRSVILRHVRDLQKVLGWQLRRLVPGEVPLGEVEDMWAAYDAIERHAAAAKTLLAARVDESHTWARVGERSADAHLARRAGTSRGAARRGLETSRRLRRLPATEAAMRRGELSQDQARTIAAAAVVNPAAEQSLLRAARDGNMVRLREQADRAKAAGDPDPDATHRRIRRQRRVRRFTDGEGAWNLQARGTADAGAVVNAALDPVIDEIFREAHRQGRVEPREAYAFDALVTLARRATGAHDPTPATPAASPAGPVSDTPSRVELGAVPTADGPGSPVDPAAMPGTRRGATIPSFMALLRVDLAALVRGRVEGDELCEIAGVGAVPARVARGLLGDAVLKVVITRGVDVVNVTSLGRGPTAAQRIALLWNTPGCTNTLCSNTLAIEHDHRTPWTGLHETTVDNLDRLCRPCHRLKTHHRWALVHGTGPRPLVPPDDPRHPTKRSAPTRATGPTEPASDPTAGVDGCGSAGAPVGSRETPTLFDTDAA